MEELPQGTMRIINRFVIKYAHILDLRTDQTIALSDFLDRQQ